MVKGSGLYTSIESPEKAVKKQQNKRRSLQMVQRWKVFTEPEFQRHHEGVKRYD